MTRPGSDPQADKEAAKLKALTGIKLALENGNTPAELASAIRGNVSNDVRWSQFIERISDRRTIGGSGGWGAGVDILPDSSRTADKKKSQTEVVTGIAEALAAGNTPEEMAHAIKRFATGNTTWSQFIERVSGNRGMVGGTNGWGAGIT